MKNTSNKSRRIGDILLFTFSLIMCIGCVVTMVIVCFSSLKGLSLFLNFISLVLNFLLFGIFALIYFIRMMN